MFVMKWMMRWIRVDKGGGVRTLCRDDNDNIVVVLMIMMAIIVIMMMMFR